MADQTSPTIGSNVEGILSSIPTKGTAVAYKTGLDHFVVFLETELTSDDSPAPLDKITSVHEHYAAYES